MAFDIQQGLLEEGQPLDFVLLALVKHLLHALHVLRGAFIQFFQRLLILFFSLRQKKRKHTEASVGNKAAGKTETKLIQAYIPKLKRAFKLALQVLIKCFRVYRGTVTYSVQIY